ncbi:hypothetical protein [Maioricimonas sp. JC845]|uniref:hypothetical protein n=1 Tax=Maioricimonas sp. JC845 TaxID=3232138 RepID=UPI003459EB09
MFSPFEELEYLADYLPDEGEAVVVTRQQGELVCQPWRKDDLRDGIEDADLYGMLVQANERLNTLGSTPLWASAIFLFWFAVLMHGVIGLGLQQWYLVPGVGLLVMYGCFHWIRYRQHRFFLREILPTLKSELRMRGITPYALLSGVRHHAELRTLLDDLIRWVPEPSRNRPQQHPGW